MKIYRLFLAISFLIMVPKVLAEKVFVAVASNFSHSMQTLVQEFGSTSEHKVVLTFGSSGKFYAQLRQGAPYDLFFSADQAKPLALEKDGLIVNGSRFTYAVGRLVLWSVKTDPLQNIEDRFKSHDFKKLALPNPKLAPYGQAAMQVLTQMNLLGSTKAKWIQGENVSQVYQFVGSGNVDLGFVAWSQVLAKGTSLEQYWLVPEIYHQPIKQDVVWLKRAKSNLAAKALLDFVRSEKAKAIIIEQGYSTVQGVTL